MTTAKFAKTANETIIMHDWHNEDHAKKKLITGHLRFAAFFGSQ